MGGGLYRMAAMSVTRNMTTKTKNRTRAIAAAAEARPLNPNTPATSAAAANISDPVKHPGL